jgi:hypothetical protein
MGSLLQDLHYARECYGHEWLGDWWLGSQRGQTRLSPFLAPAPKAA